MLKPNRKILRKEIKKDPILETFEIIENGFEKNKNTLINILIISSVIIIGGLVFLNNKKKNELEANSALNIAMVAYSNMDYDNAKFQFESISSLYEDTESEILANYYLGKIAYDKKDFNKSKLYLNKYLDKTKSSLLVCGAVKILVDISFQNENFSKSFEIIEGSKKFNLNDISKLELKLLEISAYVKINNTESARNEIERLLKIKNIPIHIKEKIEGFSGML